jgi:predicted kinase
MSAIPGSGVTVFLTGLSGAGKSTIADALVAQLEAEGRPVTVLDGDVVRTHLSSELTFSRADRDLNIRRIGWVAGEVVKHGGTVVVAAIAPYEAAREEARALVENHGQFVLVHLLHARRGLRAARRQGPLREGPRRPDPRVHRRQRSLRAAGPRRAGHRHVRDPVGGVRRPYPGRRGRPPSDVSRSTSPASLLCGTIDRVTDRGSLLVARLHIDLALVSSAVCRSPR